MTGTISLNHEQGLYVIPCHGGGFTCLGFDVCETWISSYRAWLESEGQDVPPLGASRATLERYAELKALESAIHAYHVKTRKRCPAHLTPALIGLEGKRVEVTYPDGSKTRFYVGKSSGVIPCHLEIKRRDSSGGDGVYFPAGARVQVIAGCRS